MIFGFDRSIRPLVIIGLACLGISAPNLVQASGSPSKDLEAIARHTSVLLLPALDTEPWAANVAAQRQFIVRRRTQHDFLARGFILLGEDLARRVASGDPKIDLASETSRLPENLERLGQRSGAKWVVSITVEEVAQDPASNNSILQDSFHCHCRVLVRIRDVQTHTSLIDGVYTSHDRGGTSSPVFLYMNTIDIATQEALAHVLAQYPSIVAVPEVGEVADYLRKTGETEPKRKPLPSSSRKESASPALP